VAAALMAGCSTGSNDAVRSSTTGAPTEQPPFELVGPTAALGGEGDLAMLDTKPSRVVDPEGGAIVEGSPSARGAAVRRVDGTWSELPEPPGLYGAELAAVGDTVAVVGFDCPGDPCDAGTRAGALLTPELDDWLPLDFDDAEPHNVYDSGMSPIGDGWVVGGPGFFHIDPDRSVVFAERPEMSTMVNTTSVECGNGSRLLSVELRGVEGVYDPALGFLHAVQNPLVFDAQDARSGWVAGPTPPPLEVDLPTSMCGAGELVLASPGHEISFSYQSATWTERPVGLPPPLDANRPSIGYRALDDGRLLLIGRYYGAEAIVAGTAISSVIVRHPDGRYEVTEITVDDLIVAGNIAYGLTNIETDEFRPAVYRTADIRPLDLDS
jgi:hypothetical protein